ncbi:MAG: hypothetical protein Kow0092_16780 [Deferrisomatales bacterium]
MFVECMQGLRRPAVGASEQGGRRRLSAARLTSPLRLAVVTVLTVFVAEYSIMELLEHVVHLPPHAAAILDATLLVVAVGPAIYFFVFRPMAGHIRERAAAEEARRYSEAKYRNVVEHSPTGIVLYRDGRIRFANRRFAQIVGRSPEELLEMDPFEIVDPEDRALAEELVRRWCSGEASAAEYECRVRTGSGESRWVGVRGTRVEYRGGASILANVQDITRRKLAEQALAASERELRALSSQLLTVQETERARVARDLHDSIGQALSAMKFGLEHRLGAVGPGAEGEEALRAVIPKLQSAVEEVRRISMDLHPSTLEDLGLVATLRWHCREFQRLHPSVRMELALAVAEEDVPEPLKIVVYRIVQEALHNVAKHSGAQRATVALRRRGDRLELIVEDDGVGFDPQTRVRDDGAATGYGIGSMRERASLSGGAMSVGSAPGAGTAVRAVWPLGAGGATRS